MDRRQADAYGPLLPAELAPASALSKRGIALSMQLQFMRAAEKFAAAAGAARDALRGGSDCLVVASARAHQAIALVCYAREPGVTPAARAAVSRQICSDVMPDVMLALEARRVAGTLMENTCRFAEMAWFRDFMEHSIYTLAWS